MFRLIRDQRENERSKRGRNEFVLIPNHVFGVDVFIGMRIAGFSHIRGPQNDSLFCELDSMIDWSCNQFSIQLQLDGSGMSISTFDGFQYFG